MKKLFKYIIPAAALLLTGGLSSCNDDLHVKPIDPTLQTEVEAGQLFNKCYANFGLAGNGGANGDSDVDGIDGGTSGLYRQFWNSNELPTDEAICGWGDQGISGFCYDSFDASNPMLEGYYYRLYDGVAYCNQYLAQFSDFDATMTAEVRFLRAMQYDLLLDAFGNVPFVTSVGSNNPDQISRADLYAWLVDELENNVEPYLNDPAPKKKGDTGYGRVDKAACWLLLSRLYLNAEVYTGTPEWAKAADYAKRVMDSSYQLNTQSVNGWTAYQMLFMGDNDKTSAANEIIWPILADGARTTSWGTSLFLMASTFDTDMHENPNVPTAVNGVSGQAWGGNRARPQLIGLFFDNPDDIPQTTGYAVAQVAGDDRALFNTDGRTLNVDNVSLFKSGYAVAKFTNFTTDGSSTSDATFPDTDVPFMRKAEAYLNYAEALTRQAGGTAPAEAVAAINVVRSRAGAPTYQTYSLNQILDEEGREFYFEGHRRTDLIRFGKFSGTTDYKWQWKGGTYAGRDFASFRNIFALPTKDLTANPKLKQNPGY